MERDRNKREADNTKRAIKGWTKEFEITSSPDGKLQQQRNRKRRREKRMERDRNKREADNTAPFYKCVM